MHDLELGKVETNDLIGALGAIRPLGAVVDVLKNHFVFKRYCPSEYFGIVGVQLDQVADDTGEVVKKDEK